MKPLKYSLKLRLMFTFVEFVLVAAVLSLLTSIVFAQPVRPKRVLVLYWDNKEFPGNVRFEESFKTQLRLGQREDLEYYPEYFEFSRFPEDNHIRSFHNYLKAKYSERSLDVVVASADAPLDFLLQRRTDLFPNSPIVFVAKDLPSADALAAHAGATGIHYENAYRDTLDLALRLHPGTKRVFVVSGSPEQDRRFEKAAQLALTGVEKIEITYLTDLPLNELVTRIRSLPPNSVVLYVWQQASNEQGKLLESFEVIGRLAPQSSAPIYGFGTVLLGHGIVGGYLQGPEMNGANAAQLTAQLLSGVKAQDIPVQEAKKVPMFDWRQLRRWSVLESSLPSDSVVRFQEFTFWEVYRGRIVGVLILVVLQTGFIVVLLIERKRRQRVSRALDRLNTELEERIAARTAALNAKSRELETFAYSVAHDLKAPLRGIDGYSRLLLEDHLESLNEEGRTFLNTIQSSSQEMSQLIDDLLEYTRLERRAFKSDHIELGPLIATIVDQKKREVTGDGIDFIINVNGGSLVADPNGLTQSLRNYVDNAIKFTRRVSNPKIEVGAKELTEKFLIWVRDNGVGFDMKYHDQIFDVFQRLNPSEQYPGTGVGLAIVRKAMERMGGKAWAQSKPGQGATFYLEVPKQSRQVRL